MKNNNVKILTFGIFVVLGVAVYFYFSKRNKITPKIIQRKPVKWTTWIMFKVQDGKNINLYASPNKNGRILKQLRSGESFDGVYFSDLPDFYGTKYIQVLDTNAKPTQSIGYVSDEFVKENY
jgi:hypothetical protein